MPKVLAMSIIKDLRSAAAGAAAGLDYIEGMMTASMTWITPFDAAMSA